jgi:hypothetical protein
MMLLSTSAAVKGVGPCIATHTLGRFCTHVRYGGNLCYCDYPTKRSEKPLDDEEWLAAQTAELVALGEKTNHDALLELASDLNGRKNCRLNSQDPLGRSLMGGMHVHLELLFEDGTVWLARILRETYTSFTDELSNDILLSECATLRWLESVNVPTPHLYGSGLRGDKQNKVGVAYMLIERLPGQPLTPMRHRKRNVPKS